MTNDHFPKQKEAIKRLERSLIKTPRAITVVETRKNYEYDDRIGLTSVAFIPKETSERIVSSVVDTLKSIEPRHYFYPPESLHITIKNVRTVHMPPLFSESDSRNVHQVFGDIVPQFPVIEFSLEDILAFPASVSLLAYPDDTFQELFFALDAGLKKIGVPDDRKYFSESVHWGNVTVCRFTKQPSSRFLEATAKMRNLKIGKIRVEKVHLIASNAVCDSPSTTILGEYRLRDG